MEKLEFNHMSIMSSYMTAEERQNLLSSLKTRVSKSVFSSDPSIVVIWVDTSSVNFTFVSWWWIYREVQTDEEGL